MLGLYATLLHESDQHTSSFDDEAPQKGGKSFKEAPKILAKIQNMRNRVFPENISVAFSPLNLQVFSSEHAKTKDFARRALFAWMPSRTANLTCKRVDRPLFGNLVSDLELYLQGDVSAMGSTGMHIRHGLLRELGRQSHRLNNIPLSQ